MTKKNKRDLVRKLVILKNSKSTFKDLDPELNTVWARIPNLFGIRMVECVRFSNGVQFSNGFEQNGCHLVRISNDPDHSKSELLLA